MKAKTMKNALIVASLLLSQIAFAEGVGRTISQELGEDNGPNPLPTVAVLDTAIVEAESETWKKDNNAEFVKKPQGVWLKAEKSIHKGLFSNGVELEEELKTVKKGETVILRTDMINYRQDLGISDLSNDCEKLGLNYVIVFIVRDPPNDVYVVPVFGDDIALEKVFRRGITYIKDASRCKQLIVCPEKQVHPKATPLRNARLIRTVEAVKKGREER